jgi:hypothetical protein
MDPDELKRQAAIAQLKGVDPVLSKATGLTRGLPRWKESVGSALTGGVDVLTGALGFGPESQANLMGQLLSAGLPMMGGLKAASSAKKGIKAYHGSPHDFDQFSLSKIGTGEGNQSYGHGLYFAENPQVAADYRRTLAKSTDTVINGDRLPAELAQRISKGHQTSAVKAYASSFLSGDELAQAERALDAIANGAPMQSPGRTYEVNIHADPDDFLDWDAPLNQQSEKVKQALLPHAEEALKRDSHLVKVFGTPENMDVGSAYRKLESAAKRTGSNAREASESLKAKGIPGIKYYDGMSRNKAEGTRNYIVFDEKLISIVKKYGIAGALGAGLINEAQARQLQMRQEQIKQLR